MICKNCGAKIDDNTAICEFCGAVYGEIDNLEETVAMESQVAEEEVEPTEVVEEEDTIVAEPSSDEIDDIIDENESKRLAHVDRIQAEKQVRLEEIERRRREKKRRQRRNRILITGLAILCVGAVGLGTYYMSSSSDGDDDVVIITPRPVTDATPIPVVTAEPGATELPESTVAPTEKPAETTKPVATKKPQTPATQKPAATKKPQTPSVQKPVATKKPVVNKASDFKTVAAKYNGGQIFANSSQTLLTDANLSGLSKAELRVARNEIYARRGRGFSNASLQAYFNGCSWYKLDSNYNYQAEYNNLNSVEKANIKLIKSYEAK